MALFLLDPGAAHGEEKGGIFRPSAQIMFEQSLEFVVLQFTLLGSGILMLLLQWAASRTASPNLGIFARWMRWVFIALTMTSVLVFFGYQGHDVWVIALAAFLGWFLLESGYTWLAVSALSRSRLPLFPRYEKSPDGGLEWPNDDRFIRLRGWLRKNGFKRSETLLARYEGQVLMRMAVFDLEDGKTRASFLFFPSDRGSVALACSFQSEAADGVRLVTDNLFIPFGGFYPEQWLVERRPRTRSTEKLYQRHLARCDAYGQDLVRIGADPLEEINHFSREVEKLNRELGFLTEPHEVEDVGRITSAGRFRVWLEIWTLSYLGQARRY